MFYRYALSAKLWRGGFLVFWLASVGNAYIPPASFITQQMGKKYANEPASDQDWQAMVTTTEKAALPAQMKLTKDGLSVTLPEQEAKKLDLQFVNAQWACRAKTATSCTELLNDNLKNNNINTNIVGLAIFDNEPVYIIGALPGDFSSPQLWVDKEDLFPVKAQTAHGEITWMKWISNKAFSFPRLIKIKNDKGTMSIANG